MKRCMIIIGGMFLFFCTSSFVAAEPYIEKEPSILVIYSSKDGEIDEHQRMLDMLLGHFSSQITFVSSSKVEEQDLEEVDYLFYYGEQKELLPSSVVDIVMAFEGTMVAIGHNVEQFGERFFFVQQKSDTVVIDQVMLVDASDKQLSMIPQTILNKNLAGEDESEALLVGKNENKEYPLFVKNNENYYFASDIVRPPFSIVFAEVLHEVFLEKHTSESESNPGYIRLEDIHPLVDPDHMMEIANILREKDIPYMIAVIPIYTNPITKKQYHLSDSPDLLKALKYMQDHGGSIVLHGYTHQYRASETGEGFEFWDVEFNMPIYHEPEEEIEIKAEEDFESNAEFEQYVNKQKKFERKYIEERLTKGIQELANYGIYPLAFEAPHYTMSQHGYEVVSEYFTTYVGQLQLSDQDWEIMTTAPNITKPTFLHGMQLLPETIGYVDPNDAEAIEKMMSKASEYKFVRDGMVAGFYHPYLGVDKFIELLENLEQTPNINWIDLKQLDNQVQTDFVTIVSENGEVRTSINYLGLFRSSFDYLNFHIKKIITVILWCIACIGSLAVINFLIHIFVNRHNRHQIKRGNTVG